MNYSTYCLYLIEGFTLSAITFFSIVAIQDSVRSIRLRLDYCKNKQEWLARAYQRIDTSSVSRLRRLARQHSIPRYSRLKKEELQSKIKQAIRGYDDLKAIM
jgi:hypothetical protein